VPVRPDRRHLRLELPFLIRGATVLALLLAPTGCERSSGTDTAPTPSSVPAASSKATDGWVFRPTFEQNLPPGVVGIPLLEAAMPDHAQVRIVAATARADDPVLGIDVWTYDQLNPKEVLELVGAPEPVLRLDPAHASSPALPLLRRQLAAPGTRVVRPMGLVLEDDSSLAAGVSMLQQAATTVRAPSADPRARAEALATLVRGLDDALVLELDAVGEIAHILGTQSAWEIDDEQVLSARRRLVHAHADTGEYVMTWLKKPDGWVLTELAPAPPRDTD
jgi:hypothetical protein